jgi:hypothetical protein
VFDRPAADPDDDDEDDSQSYTERLETNKKKTDAELQFKQLYKQAAVCSVYVELPAPKAAWRAVTLRGREWSDPDRTPGHGRAASTP